MADHLDVFVRRCTPDDPSRYVNITTGEDGRIHVLTVDGVRSADLSFSPDDAAHVGLALLRAARDVLMATAERPPKVQFHPRPDLTIVD